MSFPHTNAARGDDVEKKIKEQYLLLIYCIVNIQEIPTNRGLSLSYDIITKEHNGTIKTESKESEGTTFVIQLPI